MLEESHLFIVARHNVALYEYLKEEFANEPVRVILDRRQGERRGRTEAHEGERRLSDRRSSLDLQEALRTRGFVVVPAGRTDALSAVDSR